LPSGTVHPKGIGHGRLVAIHQGRLRRSWRGWGDRFRGSADALSDRSAAIGKDTARLGRAGLSRLSDETERRPLFALAVAVGVGILIGMVSRNWD
jgi:hypothetical protein